MLTLVETAMSEWGLTLEQALFPAAPGGMGLAAMLALWPALLARHGIGDGPGYADRARRRAKREKRNWLAAHFTIIGHDGQVIPDYAAR